MANVLVDSNVILDIFNEDPKWFSWSADQLEMLAETHVLVINPVIYSEVSFSRLISSIAASGFFSL